MSGEATHIFSFMVSRLEVKVVPRRIIGKREKGSQEREKTKKIGIDRKREWREREGLEKRGGGDRRHVKPLCIFHVNPPTFPGLRL